jgi:hypothetical protein
VSGYLRGRDAMVTAELVRTDQSLTPRGDVADLPTDEVRSVHYVPIREGSGRHLQPMRSNVVRRTVSFVPHG